MRLTWVRIVSDAAGRTGTRVVGDDDWLAMVVVLA